MIEERRIRMLTADLTFAVAAIVPASAMPPTPSGLSGGTSIVSRISANASRC